MAGEIEPVLILGGGINGAALARELLLNRLPVVLVDRGDIASGATAYSSRLIHGGLRYLEYGEFDLVRESLVERTRWLRLAPQYVKPLELIIPVRNRLGGVVASAGRFFAPLQRILPQDPMANPSRGLWLVRSALRLYDTYAKDPRLPRHRVYATGDKDSLPLDARQYPWQCAFYDAQVQFPERFVIGLLDDARRIAAGSGLSFEVFTYHQARWQGSNIEVVALSGSGDPVKCWRPKAIVNATGAWVDATLQELQVRSQRLIGGTKGSHFITYHEALRTMLGNRGAYAEARDGRPVFILPLATGVLVGTTDLPFEGDPHDAVATDAELDYLLSAVNGVFPDLHLSGDDIAWHYSGVRPLPYTAAASTAAITRRHWLEEHRASEIPCYSIIGGKLTTCRSLAEQAAAKILQRLELPLVANSQHRPLPEGAVGNALRGVPESQGFPVANEAESARVLDRTNLPVDFARTVIRDEWVRTLDDLVDRRLMLLHQPRLTEFCLRQLTDLLIEAGRLQPVEADGAIESTIQRLHRRHGKRVERA